MQADVTVVSLNGAHQQPVRNPADALVFSSSGRDVVMTMVAGREIYRGGTVREIDEHGFQSLLDQARTKLESTTAS
jgi:cytosine/adenosine deaminase-related metal-dependent hydrolase